MRWLDRLREFATKRPDPSSASRDALPRDLIVVFALALTVRLAHAAFLSATPFFKGPLIDAFVYHQSALALAQGHGLEQPFYQPPLVMVILSWLYRAGIEIGWGVSIVQSAAGALTCVLLVIVGRHAMGELRPRIGLATGIAAALAGPLFLYDLELLPPVWVDLLLACALALSLTGPERVYVRDFTAGLCLGIAATGWVPALVFGPALVFARRREKGRLLVLSFVVLGAILPLGWTAYHNATHGAPGVLVSWNGGLNLWLGNNAEWRRTWKARPGAEFEPVYEQPRRAGAISPSAQDRWFQARVVDDIRAHPFSAIGRTLEKLYYAWHGREIRRNQDYELLRDASPILAALQWELGLRFPFGLIAPLALLSMWRRRRERTPLVLALSVIAYSCALATFFIATRYRLPMLMLLLPFAADTALRWWEQRKATKTELVVFACLLVALNLPNDFTASLAADAKERQILRAMAWRAQERDDRAEPIARALLERYPNDANVHMLVAQIRVAHGDCASAVGHLERVAALAPNATTPLLDLARCQMELGRPDRADLAYARALALDRYQPGALRGAALVFMRTGRAPHAIMLLERLRESRQNDAGTDFDLGRLYLENGRPRDALTVLVPRLRERPDDAELAELVRRARQSTP